MINYKVGYATTSILEDMTKDILIKAWELKDYKLFNEFVIKYTTLNKYNDQNAH